jgi:hypothetical protein
MEPEGVVNVLRRLVEALVPGGVVLDLSSVPPAAEIETGGVVLGSLDEDAFFARSLPAMAGLDALAAEGVLQEAGRSSCDILLHFVSGADLLEDIGTRSHTALSDELAERLRLVEGPVRQREHCVLRRFEIVEAR